MALLAVVAVQKNVRDLAAAGPAPTASAEADPAATVWHWRRDRRDAPSSGTLVATPPASTRSHRA